MKKISEKLEEVRQEQRKLNKAGKDKDCKTMNYLEGFVHGLKYGDAYHQQKLEEGRWVSVAERLPVNRSSDFSDWVLAADDTGYIFKTRYDYEYNQWMDKPNVPDDIVTHWMSLPKPPLTQEK